MHNQRPFSLRRAFVETLEDRRLMTSSPWNAADAAATVAAWSLNDAETSLQPLVAEGEGSVVSVSMSVKKLDGTSLDPQQIQLGQTFQLIVSGQDLRTTPQGVFAVYNDLQISETSRLQLVVGETQLLTLSSNVTGGSFGLTLGSTSATVNVPANFSGTNSNRFPELAARIQSALNTALGTNATGVSVDLGAATPRFLVNFRGELLGSNAPALVGNFSGLTASSGVPSGTITDDFVPADPSNALAFRNSAVTFYTDGVRPTARFDSNQPGKILSAGATLGLQPPSDPAAVTPFYGMHFRAAAIGTAVVTPSPGQQVPNDDILIYPSISVPPSQIEFHPLSFTIVEGGNSIVDLGTLTGPFQLPGQSIATAGAEKIYKFTTTAAGTSENKATIEFNQTTGDLDFELQDADRKVIGSSTGIGSLEQISLNGRPAGTYFLRVYGYSNATNSFNLSIQAPAASIDPDSFEPNNQRQSATNLGTLDGVREVGQLTIHNSDDSDFFQFRTSATGGVDDAVRINFAHARGDLDLRLLNADGAVIVSSDSTRDFEEISLKGLPAGAYTIQVAGFSGATNPAYSLRIKAPQASIAADAMEPNNTREQAFSLAAPNGSASFSNLTIHSTTDQDWYRINLPAKPTTDNKIEVTFSHAVADLDIELYSDTGVLLRRSTGVLDSEVIPLAGLNAGDYFLRVFSYLSVPSPAYSVSLSVPTAAIAPDAWEANQTLATAANLRTIDGTFELFDLSIHNSDDVDWFRFETAGPGNTSHFAGLVFSGSLGDIDMELYDAQGVQLRESSSTNDTEIVSLNGLAGGTYFIKVHGFRGATNPRYSLSFSAPELNIAPDRLEPNEEEVSATQLRTVTGSYSLTDLSLHQLGDIDWFEFNTQATGGAQHNVTVSFQHALGDIDIVLYAANGDLVGSSTGVGNQEVLSLAGLPAGTYRLVVFGYVDSTSPHYDIDFNAPTLGTTADRLEANNSPVLATDLRSVSGDLTLENLSIHEALDQDWFRFETTGTSNATHSIDVSFLHVEGDIDIKLVDSAGTVLRNSESAHNVESLKLDGLPAGVYLVQVFGYAGAVNPNYSIAFHTPDSTQLLPDRLESNDSQATASLLRTSGDTLAGALDVNELTIHTASDVDFYQFTTVATGSAAHSVTLSYPAGAGALRLEVLNSQGAVVGTSNTQSGSESVSLSGLAAGQYFLKVTGSSTSAQNRYQLRIDAPTEAGTGGLDAWTIMVYMTASDLAQFAFQDINEIEHAVAGLPGSVNIAVLWDQSAQLTTYATDSGNQAAWGTLGRAFIEPDSNPNSIATRFELLPEASTGDPATLESFMRWAATNAPAERYAMIGWDHGAGIYGSNFDSADNATTDHLSVSEWLSALSQPGVPDIDVLAFDACLMSMAEVQYTLRDVTDVFVGSQEVVSGDGYDYRTLFNALVTRPYEVGAAALGVGFVQSYQFMTAGQEGDWDTQSAVRTDSLVDLAAALKRFTDTTVGLTASQLSAIAQAIEASIGYSDPEFRDLGSIMSGILQSSLPSNVLVAADEVFVAVNSSLVLRSADDRDSSGMSIFAPESGIVGSAYAAEYSAFINATGWSAMLQRIGTISSGRVSSGGRFGAFASTRDWAESNNIAADATNLYQLSGSGVVLGDLSLHDGTDIDWYRFTIGASGAAGHAITVAGSSATIRLELYDATGTNSLASSDKVGPSVSLAGLAAGNYSVRISSTGPVRSYQIVSSAPTVAGRNRLGDNSTEEKAYPLGLVGNQMTIPSLQLGSGNSSWFNVDTPRLPTAQWYSVTISAPATANLVVTVFDEAGDVVSRDAGSGTLTVGYHASGASESYRIQVTNAGSVSEVFNLAIDTLLGTITDISVPERLIGVGVDALPLTELVNQVGQVTVGDSRFEWADGMLRLRAGQVLQQTSEGQVFVPITVTDATQADAIVSFVLPIFIEGNPFAFHNPSSALNVNDDTNPSTGLAAITAIDALLIINEINTKGSRELGNRDASPATAESFIDTSKDGFLSAIDALLVINFLNSNPNGEGEFEATSPWTASIATLELPWQEAPPQEFLSAIDPRKFSGAWCVPTVQSYAVDDVFADVDSWMD